MAAEEQTESAPAKKSGSIMKLIIWFVVVVVSIGGGFATPLIVAQLGAPADPNAAPETPADDPNEEVEYIEFDEIIAALGKSNLTRYLKIKMSLEVPKSKRLEVEAKIEARKPVLRNRILAHLAETAEEDIAGQHGINQLRRKFQGFFNEILFDDGIERVKDVLFNELNVQ